jgi:hypothetical protein
LCRGADFFEASGGSASWKLLGMELRFAGCWVNSANAFTLKRNPSGTAAAQRSVFRREGRA